ncbi:bifunctional precorrin-2 dehydrogenase/sirohydrochlorin ferrochelatase [Natronolimnobius sp. AArcel1]|uniref:precorrin-2 dehydrogenase/sirohydrochlorin ferrochelatase family protein n=1 Tax=Natronolimnobius sp. AArcel1 TaxID=1679093 RepID=UPI0013EA3328|nr:bifunctional precorrin-2 dehydrogenase/sirohydrochlorin ferrochelatase [Natronolimnobius sp. AArcel1]NGM68041.1 bifunctional precorrin-2 dehydrogenase/sirohydrochlorin ferrochelatase [Natronolimnobius sp. AArcel1]
MIPLLHDFSGHTVLVVGGGAVGARKARRFAREADVIVVSPDFSDRDFGGATRIRAALQPAEIDDWLERTAPALVVAATDDEAINDALESAARARGCLVNRADQSGGRDPGSVVVPATVRDDPVVVAVATGGTAPSLSAYLREELEETISGAGEMATCLAEVRAQLDAEDVEPARRQALLRMITQSPELWTALRNGTPKPCQVIDDVLDENLSGGDST